MNTVNSKDGTTIAYDKYGSGPAVIIVLGALCSRAVTQPKLIEALAVRFTVYNYDRRGRGDSGDTPPYAVDREIDDLEALIDVAGGSACLYGHSSGGALVLETAAKLGNKVKKLAIYEAPYNNDARDQERWHRYLKELAELLAADRREDAVMLFRKYVGTPDDQLEAMKHEPTWPSLVAIAPTLIYDHAEIIGHDAAVPIGLASTVAVPVLVMSGGASFPFMHVTAEALGRAMPRAQVRNLEGQTHNVSADVLAPVLVEFFSS